MTAFLQTADGDLALENGRLVLVRGTVEKGQKARDLLGLATGEWFADTGVGIPWFGLVLGQRPDLDVVKRIVRTVVLSIPGVVDMPELEASFDARTRETSVTWRAIDAEGQDIPGGSNPFFLR